MIKYICKNCNDLECETSVCPVCKVRTEILTSQIYWCNNCGAPSYCEYCTQCGDKCNYIGTDLRPVFPEERLLLEIILKEPFKFANASIWNVGGSCYIVDGAKLHLSYAKIIKESNVSDIIALLNKYRQDNQHYIKDYFKSKGVINFVKINSRRLNLITHEAINYIRKSAEGKQEDEMFVSFSGGKDSTVVSDLAIKALGKNIIHIYGDTTLEYPTSASYIKRFKEKHPLIPVLTAKNKDQDFNNLCEVVGPPSRMLRWCCTIFKTGAITKKIDSTFKDTKSILAFQGIRRSESASRSKYERESNESKIKKGTTAFLVFPVAEQ